MGEQDAEGGIKRGQGYYLHSRTPSGIIFKIGLMYQRSQNPSNHSPQLGSRC